MGTNKEFAGKRCSVSDRLGRNSLHAEIVSDKRDVMEVHRALFLSVGVVAEENIVGNKWSIHIIQCRDRERAFCVCVWGGGALSYL